jgi:hypothetical protein
MSPRQRWDREVTAKEFVETRNDLPTVADTRDSVNGDRRSGRRAGQFNTRLTVVDMPSITVAGLVALDVLPAFVTVTSQLPTGIAVNE